MSVLQPISYGLVHQIGPGRGARGFGSYQADNTETIRPYQQEASSPFGRGYPMSVVSGAPTVYDPRAGIKEDPVVVLLKKILGMKTVVEKAPDAGFRSNVYVEGAETGPGGNGQVVLDRTLGEAPRERVYDDSTDYGSLNEFKSELAALSSATPSFKSANDRIDEWFDDLKDILQTRDVGVSTGSAFGIDASTSTDINLKVLDDLNTIFENTRIQYVQERGAMREAAQYIAKMVDYLQLTPLTYEDAAVLRRPDLDTKDAVRIVDNIKENYKAEISRRVREATSIILAEDEEITKKKQLSNSWTSTMPIYEGANAVGARPGVAPTGRPPMVSTGAGYSVRSRAGRFENPGRRASISSSTSSGNSFGESFDPSKPDTSKAFNRASKKKKKAWK
jgi:hypothetical protein